MGKEGLLGAEVISRPPPRRRRSQELCVITCRGDLGDPAFPKSFRRILSGLNKLLNTSDERVRVRKVEPWNSVRVTFTIPGDAAQRLRALALGGDSALARLGILSVQLDPDQVISLRVGVAGPSGVQQQVPMDVAGPSTSPAVPSLPGPSSLPGATSLGGSVTVVGPAALPGPSPLVAPSLPSNPPSLASSASIAGTAALPATTPPASVVAGPSGLSVAGASPLPGPSTLPPPPPPRPPAKVFPFHSMNQAASVMRATETPPQPNTRQVLNSYPPPPYPSKGESGQVVSPLLVNLLQDGGTPQPQPQQHPSQPNHQQVRLKEEGSSTSAFVTVRSNQTIYQDSVTRLPTSNFRRLPPPYPGSNHISTVNNLNGSVVTTNRVKEEPLADPPPPVEEKKPESTESSQPNKRQYLINPLTGVLEPMSSEDEEEEKTDQLPEEEMTNGEKMEREEPPIAEPPSPAISVAPVVAPTVQQVNQDNKILLVQPKEEKIKLRLKLDKETVVGSVVTDTSLVPQSPLQTNLPPPGYKVEMYVKPSRSHEQSTSTNGQPSLPLSVPSVTASGGIEEPRVPPLHISLRGRNAAVVVAPKKDKKRDAKKEVKRPKSSKCGRATSCSPEPEVDAEPTSPGCEVQDELTDDIVPVRNYPSEAEVASILRSVVPHTTHKLLDESRIKRRESKKKMYPRLEYTGSKKGAKKGSAGSLLKSVVKTNSKEVRMMSAVNKAIHRRDSADNALPVTTSNTVFNSGNGKREEFRPKVNCVFGGGPVKSEEVQTKVVVNMCVGTGSPPSQEVKEEKKEPEGTVKRNNEGGEDSGIESMDALSEKSPNQGESPQRTTSGGGKSTQVACGESPKPDQPPETIDDPKKDDDQLVNNSGGGESPVPVRLTPALYTYSNPEKLERRGGESSSPSSVSGDDEPDHKDQSSRSLQDEDCFGASGRRGGGKSLLEQLLIEIPVDNRVVESRTERRSRSRRETERVRKASESSHDSTTNRHSNSLRVNKRKLSESGDGKEDGSPVGIEKNKLQTRSSASNQGDDWSEDDVCSTASAESCVASTRSSVSPALHSPRLRLKNEESAPPSEKNNTANVNSRREVSVVLTKISRRVSVRQQKTGVGTTVTTTKGVSGTQTTAVSTQSKESPSARRKTRSQVADSHQDEGGSAVKRRRTSKDVK